MAFPDVSWQRNRKNVAFRMRLTVSIFTICVKHFLWMVRETLNLCDEPILIMLPLSCRARLGAPASRGGLRAASAAAFKGRGSQQHSSSSTEVLAGQCGPAAQLMHCWLVNCHLHAASLLSKGAEACVGMLCRTNLGASGTMLRSSFYNFARRWALTLPGTVSVCWAFFAIVC